MRQHNDILMKVSINIVLKEETVFSIALFASDVNPGSDEAGELAVYR